MWTHFWDMHSGGGQKLDWGHIYIEAPEDEARRIFFAKFHRDPDCVTCTCCGPDYSVSEYETIDEATEFQRGDLVDNGKGGYENKIRDTVEQYIKNPNVKVVFVLDITDEERGTEYRRRGYVWQD